MLAEIVETGTEREIKVHVNNDIKFFLKIHPSGKALYDRVESKKTHEWDAKAIVYQELDKWSPLVSSIARSVTPVEHNQQPPQPPTPSLSTLLLSLFTLRRK